jgi:hypothetical protein
VQIHGLFLRGIGLAEKGNPVLSEVVVNQVILGGLIPKEYKKNPKKHTHKKKHMPWHISPNAHTNPCKWTSLYSILIHFTYPIYDPWLFAAHSSNLTSKVTSIMGQFSSWLPIIWANKALM